MENKDSLKYIFKNFKLKDFLIDNLYFLIGCTSYALGVNIFAIPNRIAQSGITGLAIIINYLLPRFPVGLTGFVLNIPLIILAWIFIGKRFTLKTLWVTTILSVVIDVAAKLVEIGVLAPYTGDKLLASLFCGAMSGFGLAMVIVRGATTGGTDVAGRLLKKIWPFMSMGRMIMACDAAVVILAAIVFKSAESAMYAAILIFVSSEVMDFILYGAGNGKILLIFTQNGEDVAKTIIEKGRRGATIIETKGGYTDTKGNLVLCAARNTQIPRIRKLVKETDPDCFIVLSEANEILGKGFTPPPNID